MADDLKLGEKVRLNSGGPDMEIIHLDAEHERVLAAWPDDGWLSHSWFPAVCVQRVQATAI